MAAGRRVGTATPRADGRQVRRYERLLRTGRHDALAEADADAFERLSPAQLDVLFEHAFGDAERPSAPVADAPGDGAGRDASERDASGEGVRCPWLFAALLDSAAWYASDPVLRPDWTREEPGGSG